MALTLPNSSLGNNDNEDFALTDVNVMDGPKRLHVSNIPFRYRESDLRQLIAVSGPCLTFMYLACENKFNQAFNYTTWKITNEKFISKRIQTELSCARRDLSLRGSKQANKATPYCSKAFDSHLLISIGFRKEERVPL